MFTLTEDMLKILINLGKSDGWPIFLGEFRKIRDENVANAIHFNPDALDANARERQTLLRGVAVCLDVLCNAFSDPITLLEDIKLVEKTEDLKKDLNPF